VAKPASLGVAAYPDAVIVPPSSAVEHRRAHLELAVLDRHGALIEAAVSATERKGSAGWRPSPAQAAPTDRLAGRWLFGGLASHHFGHQITRSLGRLAGLAEAGRVDGIVYVPTDFRSLAPGEFEALGRLLAGLRIALPLRLITQTTRVEELVVGPDRFGEATRGFADPGYVAWARATLVDPALRPVAGRRLYVTRRQLGPLAGRFLCEDLLEENLRAAGYEVFAPERASVAEQIAAYRLAERIVAAEGSALHLVAFAADAGARVAAIQRSEPPAYLIVNHLTSFLGPRARFVDAVKRLHLPPTRRSNGAIAALDFAALREALVDWGGLSPDAPWAEPSAETERASLFDGRPPDSVFLDPESHRKMMAERRLAAASAPARPTPAPRTPDTGRRVLFSAQKNEGPFLLEWIAYHKVVGFTDIVICSNDCDDGSDVLLDRLHEAGEVMHIRQIVAADLPPQQSAARVAQQAGVFRHGDWVMWLDADEFLLPSSGEGRLDDLIASAGDADAVMVAWRMFGDGGNDRWPGRHVSAAFTRAAPRRIARQTQVKTLFRYGPAIERLDIHRPVLREGFGPEEFRVITSAREPAAPEFFDRRRKYPFNRMTNAPRPYRLAQVVHFSIRTPDMFALKARRGDGYFGQQSTVVVRDSELYRKRNANQTEETGLLRHEAATVAEMKRLLNHAEVRRACFAIPHFAFPEWTEDRAAYPMPVRFWTAKPNFGDLIGPMLVEGLSGRSVRKEKQDDSGPFLLSVGSIIQTIDKPGAVIWGAGLLRPIEPRWRERILANPIAKVAAVRGRLTDEELTCKLGLDVPEVYGDPALLLPRLFPIKPGGGGIVLCPHLNHRQFFRTVGDPGIKVLDVAGDPMAVIRAIATADVVISSSLHGLVVAQAYGVPWLWMQMEMKPLDRSDFKFRDFFSTLIAPKVRCFSFAEGPVDASTIRAAATDAECFELSVDLDALARSLPDVAPAIPAAPRKVPAPDQIM
jgi:capsular polysaccharide biosynthesis protein